MIRVDQLMSMTERGVLLKWKCVVTLGVFWRVKECVANQSHIVSMSVHPLCIRS